MHLTAGGREVILLEAGYLSTQSRERTSRLIQAVADLKEEQEPYQNLSLRRNVFVMLAATVLKVIWNRRFNIG